MIFLVVVALSTATVLSSLLDGLWKRPKSAFIEEIINSANDCIAVVISAFQTAGIRPTGMKDIPSGALLVQSALTWIVNSKTCEYWDS